jgi:DNA polymerase, archaea type
MIANGWLFDIYHLKDRVVLWIKENNDDERVKRLEYPWSPSIYVAADTKSELNSLIRNGKISSFVKESEFTEKHEYPSKQCRKEVLKLTVNDSSQITALAKNIENLCSRFGHYRLYNVDVSPEQSFLYENDVYPLGLYNIGEKPTGPNGLSLYQIANDKGDSVDSFDYIIPNFRFLSFDLASEKKTIDNDLNDRISKIRVVSFDKDSKDAKEKFSIMEDTELETILEFAYEINRIDPDIVLTTGGDQFLFPRLFHRAKANGIETQLLVNLNRETDMGYLIKKNFSLMEKNTISPFTTPESGLSSSYVSYGKVHFKPRPFLLYGRIHIDTKNSFIYKDNGLDGLAELSRVCRMPLQPASRSTIGRCLSSLYFYNAQKKDILIPWKPVTSEIFKSFSDLLKADRGGFVFESKPGAYDKVAELDFVSLYPNIMLKRNVSSDTINCDCCESEPDNKVPGLEHLYHLCKERMGIVPLSLKTVLTRRLEYKNRKKNSLIARSAGKNEHLKNLYDNRQTALKWILVTSFGYLGFSNSKFGRIDAHIAVCAFARDILLKTSKIAEKHGFEVIHGIVDSIWIREKDCIVNHSGYAPDISKRYMDLKKDIEEETGFSISFEGVYKWIVFDSSKTNPKLPALNRYFGVFEDGTTKARGIETRRHDTPKLFIDFQDELLQAISRFNSVGEVKQSTHALEDIHKKYRNFIVSGKASHSDLTFTKRLSKDTGEYSSRDTIENCVLKILSNNGKTLHAGEEIKYVITDFYSKNHLVRALPIELIDKHLFKYDEKRYLELLSDAYESITKFFYLDNR